MMTAIRPWGVAWRVHYRLLVARHPVTPADPIIDRSCLRSSQMGELVRDSDSLGGECRLKRVECCTRRRS
jgi:hypothetical protein